LRCKRSVVAIISTNQQGFTLIEILIAITLLSFLMIGVYQIVENSTITKEMVTNEDRELLQLETVWARFDLDFSLIYSPRYFVSLPKKKKDASTTKSIFVPSDNFPKLADNYMPIPKIETPDRSSLVFMTAANRRKRADTSESTFAWVKYSLQRGGDGSKGSDLVRMYYAKDPYAEETEWGEIKPQLLLTNVKKLQFQFWSSKKERFLDKPTDLAPEELVKLVKVEMTWIDAKEIEHEISRTFRPLWPHFDPIADQLQIQQATSELPQGDDQDDK
jgi:prepilin-type N-terminal cleavage/methylation domain-containing protein